MNFREKVIRFGGMLTNAFDRPYQGRNVELKDDLILPPSIRAALNGSPDASINKTELTELVEREDFIDQSIYLLLKILNDRPDIQQRLIQEIAAVKEMNPDNLSILRSTLKNYLDFVDQKKRVKAGKLVQISSQGFYTWDQKYMELARDWKIEYGEQTTPVLIGYATLMGLKRFLEKFPNNDINLYIIIPEWVKDGDSEFCGYCISKNETVTVVDKLRKNFSRPKSAIIIDETMAKGTTLNSMTEFWKNNDLSLDVRTTYLHKGRDTKGLHGN